RSSTQLIINVKVPLKKNLSKMKLFKFIPTPFAYKQRTCQLSTDIELLIVDKKTDNIYPLSASDIDSHCDLINHKICQIPKYQTTIPDSHGCIQQLYKGADINTLSNICTYKCVNSTKQQIHEVTNHKLMITHPILPISITCKDYTQNRQIRTFPPIGILTVSLP